MSKTTCENCGESPAKIPYHELWFCSFLCIGAFSLNQDPSLKDFNQSMGLTKKDDDK